MVLSKTDVEMNMQNCEYSAKWRRWWLMLHGWRHDSCHGPTPSIYEEMTRCRCKKHHWRWPGNPNGRSKFHKYRAYLPILRQWDRDWCSAASGDFQRSLKRNIANVKNITDDDQVTVKIDQNAAITEIYAYKIKQGLPKNIFLLLDRRHNDTIAQGFSYYHLQRLMFSPTKNNFSTTFIPPKNRDIHIEEFFM